MWTRGRLVAAALVAAAAAMLTGCGAHDPVAGGHADPAAASSPSPIPPPALTVAAVIPAASAGRLAPTQPLAVRMSAPITDHSPTPTLSPKVPGRWSRTGPATFTFTPSQPYPPYADVVLTVPSGSQGPHARNGGLVAKTRTFQFQGPEPVRLRAQQILARLHYLPLTVSGVPDPGSMAQELAAAYTPHQGGFAWRFGNVPKTLRELWSPGRRTVLTQGAIMAFQHQHGLTMDGLLGAKTWAALLQDDLADKIDPEPYSYVWADLRLPQRLSVWVDGSVRLTSPVNSGVAGARTVIGTYPVYYRRKVMTMSGTNPDGTHYSDPGVPWSSFFYKGQAVHGFPRPSYGHPQSVGCLELPIPTADKVFHMIDYGTLVTTYGDPTALRNPAPPTTASTTKAAPTGRPAPTRTPAPTRSAAPAHSPSPAPSHSRSPRR